MKMVKPLLLLLVLVSVAGIAPAYENEFSFPDGNYINDYAFSDNFVWCATHGSLVRWNKLDGTYVQFTTDNGLAHNIVLDVAVDKKNDLWIGTLDGLQRYNGSSFITYTKDNSGLADSKIYSIEIDEAGNVWVGTEGGLSVFDGSEWTSYTTDNSGIAANPVTDIALDLNGVAWLSHDLSNLDKDKRIVESFDGSQWVNYGLEHNSATKVRTIKIDNDNVKWFAGALGLYSYDGENFTRHSDVSSPNDIEVAPDGSVWAACGTLGSTSTTSHGLLQYDGSAWTEHAPDELISYPVWAYNKIRFDFDGTPWFVTKVTSSAVFSLHSYDGLDLKTYLTEGPRNYLLQDMFVDSSNNIWFGSYFGTAKFNGNEWDNYSFTLTEDDLAGGNADSYLSQANIILSFAEDHDNVIWIGCGFGIRSFDGSNWKFYGPNNTDNMVYHSISDIAIDNNNVKWFATGRNICSLDGETWKAYKTFETRPTTVAVDTNGIIWVGTFYDGVWSFDGTTWTHFSEEDYGIKGMSSSLTVDHNNVKWFANTEGLWSYDGTNWKLYTNEDMGYYDDAPHTNDMFVDDNNILWLSKGNTLLSYDGITWKLIENITVGRMHKMVLDNNGYLWLGGYGGIGDTGLVTSLKIAADPTYVMDETVVPSALNIMGNYPNPFNPSTTIEFSLPETGFINLVIYNMAGQKVRELVSETMSGGVHSVVWNGFNDSGLPVSTGLYMSRLTMGDAVTTGRMLLMK